MNYWLVYMFGLIIFFLKCVFIFGISFLINFLNWKRYCWINGRLICERGKYVRYKRLGFYIYDCYFNFGVWIKL